MAKRKVTTPQLVPQSAEIVSFLDLQERRAAREAEYVCEIAVARKGFKTGDIVLCSRKAGGYQLALCVGTTEGNVSLYDYDNNIEDVESVLGRVVWTGAQGKI
jgi:hypothetical protein